MQPSHIERSVIAGGVFSTLAESASTSAHFFSPQDLPKSIGNLAVWFSLIQAESLALPRIAQLFMVSSFMQRASLSDSKAWPKCARFCDPDAFHSGSASPIDAPVTLHPAGHFASSTPFGSAFDNLGGAHISTSTSVCCSVTVFSTEYGKGGEGVKGGDFTDTTRQALRPSASAC